MLRTRLSNLATRHSLIGSSIPETIAENILRKCEYAIVRLNIEFFSINLIYKHMTRKSTTLKVSLPNGQDRVVIKSPDYETRDGFIYSPRKLDDTGYGVCFENLNNAIEFMFQQDCKHNIISNTTVSEHKNFTPLPYKCSICNKHFYTKPYE